MLILAETLNPLDGRYKEQTDPLLKFFSEKALFKYRNIVELEYLLALSELGKLHLRKFTQAEKKLILALENFTDKDYEIVKQIEKTTNHDVKALEYLIKEKLKNTSLNDISEWVHFALTSDDVNEIAYGLMISESLNEVIIPALSQILQTLENFSSVYKDLPMLARTHGQPATPTTFGKEFKVFACRLQKQLDQLSSYKVSVKLNGATGNYNAHAAAYPNINWLSFSKNFINSFNKNRKIKLQTNVVTTQIESHDNYAELFDLLRRINIILIGFDQDIWRYISDNWITQKPKEGEVGSSTMPHKINPIDFENSEGNLGLANALLNFFSFKLPISRLQRDLSDSTVLRNIGVAFGYCLVGYTSIIKGLGKISINKEVVVRELEQNIQVVAEAIQTILKREGVKMPYEQLRELTRGKHVTSTDLDKFIDGLYVSNKIKLELKNIKPVNYLGIAKKLATFNKQSTNS